MIFNDYYYIPEESTGDMTSYEEQLLLNYDDYLQGNLSNTLTSHKHFNLELDDLEDEFLDDDMESEYDENDWEELDNEDDSEPETFLMQS
ncbi:MULTISPECIES: hypothetical protein [Flavobacterium]|uniref:hypothetical protein n=1 Tax=Flavobacterium TaxID=237 RepID=UPI002114EA57|nr:MULTISPECIES: hypothetical protein [Flavobacterium]UUF13853.1 hypothetical protein NLJ00_21610 [Flavobacterium panici]